MSKLQARFARTLILSATLVAGCLPGSPAAGAAEGWNAQTPTQIHTQVNINCPTRDSLDAALGEASELMRQSRFEDAVTVLQPPAAKDCDARASLLLSAAFEARDDRADSIAVLKHAHNVWPANNSVSASLAREYLASGDNERAARALAHFHGTAETPEQELEMAVVVYFAAQQLPLAQAIAEQDYKYHPSVHSLLLLANALQLQGRYPDVNRLLAGKREMYADSPEFFVTLAESEADASIYAAARKDLHRAISLNPNLYQAHYLLGNLLVKTNDPDGGIAEYRLAIALAPERPRTYYQLALVLRGKQDDAGERQALEQALTADDHYAPAHCEMGRILLDEDHRPSDAVSHLLSAIQYNPRSEEAYFLLARAYAKLGDKAQADEIVKRLQVVRKENHTVASRPPSP